MGCWIWNVDPNECHLPDQPPVPRLKGVSRCSANLIHQPIGKCVTDWTTAPPWTATGPRWVPGQHCLRHQNRNPSCVLALLFDQKCPKKQKTETSTSTTHMHNRKSVTCFFKLSDCGLMTCSDVLAVPFWGLHLRNNRNINTNASPNLTKNLSGIAKTIYVIIRRISFLHIDVSGVA